MSESSKLFPDGSAVRLLVGVEGEGGRTIEAGATGIVASVSEEGRFYHVRFGQGAGESAGAPDGAVATVEAGNLILE